MLTVLWPMVLAQTTANGLPSLLDVSPGDRFPLLVVGIVFTAGVIVATVAIVGGILHSYQRQRLEADLKRELLDRGMSAEEVARVVEASAGKRGCGSRRVT